MKSDHEIVFKSTSHSLTTAADSLSPPYTTLKNTSRCTRGTRVSKLWKNAPMIGHCDSFCTKLKPSPSEIAIVVYDLANCLSAFITYYITHNITQQHDRIVLPDNNRSTLLAQSGDSGIGLTWDPLRFSGSVIRVLYSQSHHLKRYSDDHAQVNFSPGVTSHRLPKLSTRHFEVIFYT